MIFKCIYYYYVVKRMGPELTSGPGWRHESLNSHGITIYNEQRFAYIEQRHAIVPFCKS